MNLFETDRPARIVRRPRGLPAMLAVALLAGAAPGLVNTARAATVGPNDKWSGTVSVRITIPPYQVPGINTTVQGSCTATIRLNGAVATETTTMTGTKRRQNTPQPNQTTTTTIKPDAGAGTSQTVPTNGGGATPVLVNPNPNFNNADYTLEFFLPSIPVRVASEAIDSSGATIPGSIVSPPPTSASCGTFLNLLGGFSLAFPTEPPRVTLPGPLVIQGTAPGDGASISGSVKGSVTDQTNNNRIMGTVTVTWNLRDISVQQPKAPTGKIKVTNNGIDATLDWDGWEFSYSGDWKQDQTKAGAPKITSPDQKVTITVQVQPMSGQPSATNTKTAINQAAGAAGNVASISYKPFAIGALKGQIGVVTLANSPDTLLVVAVSDGQHQVITQMLVAPNTPPADLLEAGMAIGSIHQIG